MILQRANERPEIHRFGYFPDIQISDYLNKKVPNLAVQTNGYGPDMENSVHFGPLHFWFMTGSCPDSKASRSGQDYFLVLKDQAQKPEAEVLHEMLKKKV